MSKETEIAVLTEDKEILSTFKKVEKTNENGKLVDLENCYVTEEREEIDSSAILENMLSVKNFGTYFCIGDYDFVLKFREILFAYFDKNENCHAVIKVHIVENVPLLLFFSITFLQLKKPVVKEKLKFNFIQNLSDGVSKPREVKLKNLEKTFAYVRDTCAYQLLFQNFNPGTVNKFRYREKLWSDKTDLTISVIDTDDKELIELIEDRDPSIFVSIPGLLILKSLDGEDQGICFEYNPNMNNKQKECYKLYNDLKDDYEKMKSNLDCSKLIHNNIDGKSNTVSRINSSNRLLSLSSNINLPSIGNNNSFKSNNDMVFLYNFLERAILFEEDIEKVLVDMKVDSNSKFYNKGLVNKFLGKIKTLSMNLQREKPSEWNSFFDMSMNTISS